MTTVTCPRCGLSFETRALTNTRCRRCRYVVTIGRRPASTVSTPAETSSASSAGTDPTPTTVSGSPGTPMVLGAALVGAGALGLWHGWRLDPADGADPEPLRRARLRGCLGGGLAVIAGLAVVVFSVRSE